jgi:hypothetical protein
MPKVRLKKDCHFGLKDTEVEIETNNLAYGLISQGIAEMAGTQDKMMRPKKKRGKYRIK